MNNLVKVLQVLHVLITWIRQWLSRRRALLCALTLPLAGCSAAADATSAPAPATPGALVTDSWFYESQGALVEVPGTWVHVPAAEAGELELWIEQAEEAAWN